MELEIEIDGIEELTKKRLDKLVYHIDKATMEPIIRAGAQKMRKYISAAAPQGKTGNLKRGQIAKLLPRKNEYPTVGLVRPNWKIAPHSSLVEKGHAIVTGGTFTRTETQARRKAFKGESRGLVKGFVKPHPYFWPTYNAHKDEIQREIMDKIISEVEKV